MPQLQTFRLFSAIVQVELFGTMIMVFTRLKAGHLAMVKTELEGAADPYQEKGGTSFQTGFFLDFLFPKHPRCLFSIEALLFQITILHLDYIGLTSKAMFMPTYAHKASSDPIKLSLESQSFYIQSPPALALCSILSLLSLGADYHLNLIT